MVKQSMTLFVAKMKLDNRVWEMTVQATKAAKEAAEQIRKLIGERAEGGVNRLDEALAIADAFGIEKDWVRVGFQQAEQGLREAATAKSAAPAAAAKAVAAIAKIAEVKKGEVKKKAEGVALRGWSEVAIPTGANEVEALTYVPGLVGDIVEWIVKGAKRPPNDGIGNCASCWWNATSAKGARANGQWNAFVCDYHCPDRLRERLATSLWHSANRGTRPRRAARPK